MFTRVCCEVDDIPDDAENSSVSAASGSIEVCAAIGGGCSAVSVSDSGGILRLVRLPPLHL